MPIIMNATEETQTFKVFGSWFTFKPSQQKLMDEDKARFIVEHRKEYGMVSLPAAFEEDANFAASEEGKKILSKAKEDGVSNYLASLREIIKNNQVHLRGDLAKANIQADPAAYATDAELKAMETLARYNRLEKDSHQEKIDQVKKLMKEVGPLK